VRSSVNDGVEVRRSAIHGTGLFVRRAFRAGDVVYTVAKGRVVRRDEIATLTPLQRNHLDRIDEDAYEVIEPPGCDINHSCDPSVVERDRRGIALRDLKAGDEVTLDYDPMACLDEPFPCRCGAKACRGVVRGRE
jgi:SET domain-containing protein